MIARLVKYATGAPNYARCYNAYLHPGETATMTVTYRTPAYGWVGWVYGTNGSAEWTTAMETDSNPGNNFVGGAPYTEIVP